MEEPFLKNDFVGTYATSKRYVLAYIPSQLFDVTPDEIEVAEI